jgi:hypothetical protein
MKLTRAANSILVSFYFCDPTTERTPQASNATAATGVDYRAAAFGSRQMESAVR